jgi:hypothetical protein
MQQQQATSSTHGVGGRPRKKMGPTSEPASAGGGLSIELLSNELKSNELKSIELMKKEKFSEPASAGGGLKKFSEPASAGGGLKKFSEPASAGGGLSNELLSNVLESNELMKKENSSEPASAGGGLSHGLNKRGTNNQEFINQELNNQEEIIFEGEINADNIRLRQITFDARDLICLGRNRWLNANVILNWLRIALRSLDDNINVIDSSVWHNYIWNNIRNMDRPEFKNLCFGGYKENWKFIVVPVWREGDHWGVAICDDARNVTYFDSLRRELNENIKERIKTLYNGITEDTSLINFVVFESDKYYQQRDTHSCGVCVCMNAYKFIKETIENGDFSSLKYNMVDVQAWRTQARIILQNELARIGNGSQMIASDQNMEIEYVRPNAKKLTLKEKKEIEAKRKRISRDNEKDQGKKRKLDDAERKKESRLKESEEERIKRIEDIVQRKQNTTFSKKQEIKNKFSNIARNPIENEDDIEYYDVGNFEGRCIYCEALFFKGEHVQGNKKGEYFECCSKGKFKLDLPFSDYPEKLYNLMIRDEKSLFNWKKFHENMRRYNAAFAFGSMQVDKHIKGVDCYKIQGMIYRRVNLAAFPDAGNEPSYGQLFLIDTEEALDIRMKHEANRVCESDIMRHIDSVLEEINPYYDGLKSMKDVYAEELEKARKSGKEPAKVRLLFNISDKVDKRRYNMPKSNEIAAVLVLQDGQEVPRASKIIVHPEGKQMYTLSKFDKETDSMLYPLFFPTGKGGAWKNMVDKNDKRMTFAMYYRYLTAIRMTNKLKKLGCIAYIENGKNEKKGVKYENNEVIMGNYEWDEYNKGVDESFNPLRLGGKLYHQFLVDAYVKIEQDRLEYNIKHQKDMKVESYKALNDYLVNTGDKKGKKVGKVFVLPSSFKGGPRYQKQAYQDAIAMVRSTDRPHLFITMTGNEKWPEIQRNLLPGNTANDEPDLIDRVFALKLKELIDDCTKKEIFGKVKGFTYVVEFQKRGTPHAHILLILDKDSYIKRDDIDNVVYAEVPDKELFPQLYEKVTKYMVHGPCGALNPRCSCMEMNKGVMHCTKKYPKEFVDTTDMGRDSYANYRRRKFINGEEIKFEHKRGCELDNRWVVPHSRYLILKYDCHINVEICASIAAFKYLYKYVYKGHDCADVKLVNVNENTGELVYNEIAHFEKTRYVTPHEAFYRIQELKLSDRSHTVMRLILHLPDEQAVYFEADGDENIEDKIEKSDIRDSTLTAWLNINNPEHFSYDSEAANYYYFEIPEHYMFEKNGKCKNCKELELNKRRKNKKDVDGLICEGKEKCGRMYWKKRVKIVKPAIGRMPTINPKNEELFSLRCILTQEKGVKNWEELYSFEGKKYESFKAKAVAMGFFKEENWHKIFDEMICYQMPKQLREMFVSILNHVETKIDVKETFDKYKEHFFEKKWIDEYDMERCENLAKADIERMLNLNGMTLSTYGMSLPDENDLRVVQDYNREEELSIGNVLYDKCNEEQREIVDFVFDLYEKQRHGTLDNGCVFIEGVGGSGKTYIYRTLCHLFRGQNIRFKVSSWMGVAAILLPEGRTMHRTFGLPFNLDCESSCFAKPNNKLGKELINTDVIIIDEISMVPKYALEMIDKKLRELNELDVPFGGKIVLNGGDFRQILPVKSRVGRSELVSLSVRHSYLWKFFKKNLFRLKKNMRAAVKEYDNEVDVPEKEDFADWLVKLGEDELFTDEDGYVDPPEYIKSKDDLIEESFGDLSKVKKEDREKLAKKARILTVTNEKANEYNDEILSRLKLNTKELKTSLSIDRADSDDPSVLAYPEEFLHKFNEGGMPLHELKMIEDCPVMLLRNLNPAIGLCNGTNLLVKSICNNSLLCEILTGDRIGNIVMIPKITVKSDKGTMPFTLSRKQFPVRVCYAMTINKSQGQTIDFVGLDLSEDTFAHGMTYVAFSRARAWNCIRVKGNPDKGNKVKNVVWKEALMKSEENEGDNDEEIDEIFEAGGYEIEEDELDIGEIEEVEG